MRIFRDLDSLPNFENTVITIGSFDGVHLGHQKIIERINQLAKDINGESLVVSFHPHPRAVIYPKDKSLRLLNTLDEKLDLLRKHKVDTVVIVPFSVEFSQMNAREYVENFLLKRFNPSYIVIGYDHKFGLNRSGDINLLKQYEAKGSFKLQEITKKEIEDITISSTKIRKALLEGNLAQANALSNHPYRVSGKVIEGHKIGNTIGFPTANIKPHSEHKLVPQNGIYAVHVFIEDERYEGMLYIGDRPSLNDGNQTSIEVNIFDFNDDIYHKNIQIELLHYIRDDAKFDSLESLTSQITLDEKEVRIFFSQFQDVKPKPNIAIAILNYNGQNFLESYLPSVGYSSKRDFETYVIDNASTDDTIEMCNEWFPEVKLISFVKNHGFAEGYNRGILQIDNEFLVLLNSDVMVHEDWLDPIIEIMEKDKTIGACMPKILSLDENHKFEYAGASGGYMDSLGYPFCRGRIFDEVEEDTGQYDTEQEVFWASGAALVIRNSVFRNFEGFDPDYFAHMEEIDLCWRIKRAGYKVKVIPQSKVYHLGGGTMHYENPNKTYLNFRNNLSTLIKNESIGKLLWLFPFRLLLDGIAGLKFLFEGKSKNTLAIVKAHLHLYGSFPKLLKKRKKYNRLITKHSVGPKNMIGKWSGSIVVQYYLKKKKHFSKIYS